MYSKNISLINGIIIFGISLTVYLLTLEPTVSYWDCGEFITCAYGLEVGHAPGAPLFMLLGRVFGLLAGNDHTNVAMMVNGLSATASALTVMFLYWTLLYFSQKVCSNNSKLKAKAIPLILHGAALIGALTYAFTDSFWFSAVEGEVYATSSLFSAIVFWAILQWEKSGSNNNRWIILIFYLLGLSVGIHLLNILAIPAMAFIVYFKKYKYSHKGIFLTFLISFLLIIIQIFVTIPGIANFAAYTDLLFVNTFNMPVYSGALTAIAILSFSVWLGYRYFTNNKRPMARLIILAFTFWAIGYSSFGILVIRSNADPFVDINNVENIFGLVNYLNREQYPSRPLIKGNNYNSPITGLEKRYTYKLLNGKYIKDELNPKYLFDKNTLTLFPRMASLENRHQEAYKNWIEIKGRKVRSIDGQGNPKVITVPTLSDNLRFFFKYQVGHMYLRYFMWNFAGKQNDIQGFGNNLEGNWISGIPFIDKVRLGDQASLPFPYFKKETRNRYYFIPLIVGLIGMFYQYKKDNRNFWAVLLLFFFTGIAIVIYLNEVPVTPRERDYVHVGSFYAFTIWIGLGTIGILEKISTFQKPNLLVGLCLFLLTLAIPINLLVQNYNDHDRSNRYTARDFAKNTLTSCRKNAILLTTADNDTYPIWYIQEVEGYRQDVRQVLSTFLPVDWYAMQLEIPHKNKGKLNISFRGEELLHDRNNYFPIVKKTDSTIDLNNLIPFLRSNDQRTKVTTNDNNQISYIPGTTLSLKVDKEKFLNNYPEFQSCSDSIPEQIVFKLRKQNLHRDDVLLLDILANNNWERPVYMVYPELVNDLGLSDYVHSEGGVYCLLPFKKLPSKPEQLLTEKNYNLITKSFVWGNVEKEDVFLDFHNIRMIGSLRYKSIFADLGRSLSELNEKEKAEAVVDLSCKLFPSHRVAYSFYDPGLAEAYYAAGSIKKGDDLVTKIYTDINRRLKSYTNEKRFRSSNNSNFRQDLYIMQQLIMITEQHNRALAKNIKRDFNNYYKLMAVL